MAAGLERPHLHRLGQRECLAIPRFRFVGIRRLPAQRDLAEGTKLGVDGTPTFFINGTALVGAQPLDAFTAIIDKALGAPPESQGAPK